MKTKLRTKITVEEMCQGFIYNELEGKGLYGLSGKLIIQPEYQRNYLYAESGGKMEQDVIHSLLKGYPLGLLYFNTRVDGKLEVLDGQQRITSIGRFYTGKFGVRLQTGEFYNFDSLPTDLREKIKNSKLLIYECVGEETEIREWFKTINIKGIPLNAQEIRNASYYGRFVTLAKAEFSNSQNANVNKWGAYIEGNVKRQEYLERALDWVSQGNIDLYMSQHRYDDNIEGLKSYFNSVIDWVSTVFSGAPHPKMCGLKWGELYEQYHSQSYNPAEVRAEVERLDGDSYVTNKSGIFEYILGGQQEKKLLNVRVFDEATKKSVHAKQTAAAKASSTSNCPLCAIGHDANKGRIYKFEEMDADHVSAWSKGGATSADNCEMLCKTHNRAKGNR